MHQYKPARFELSEHQIHKIKHGHKVRLAHHQIGKGPHTLFLHPLQHDKVATAHAKGKGVDLIVSDGEMEHTVHSGAEGTGIWDTIKSGFKKYVKPILGGIGDAIAYSNPELAPIREGVRSLTGVGLHHPHHPHHMKAEHHAHHEAHKKGHKKGHKRMKHGNGLYL